MSRWDRSAEAAKWRKWYCTRAWALTRDAVLAERPFCEFCIRQGIHEEPATVVDHAEPHKGDWVKFLSGPFNSLCKPHHDSAKQSEERRGYHGEADDDGWPVDERHPANKPR